MIYRSLLACVQGDRDDVMKLIMSGIFVDLSGWGNAIYMHACEENALFVLYYMIQHEKSFQIFGHEQVMLQNSSRDIHPRISRLMEMLYDCYTSKDGRTKIPQVLEIIFCMQMEQKREKAKSEKLKDVTKNLIKPQREGNARPTQVVLVKRKEHPKITSEMKFQTKRPDLKIHEIMINDQ